jgi:hypothetical protein
MLKVNHLLLNTLDILSGTDRSQPGFDYLRYYQRSIVGIDVQEQYRQFGDDRVKVKIGSPSWMARSSSW